MREEKIPPEEGQGKPQWIKAIFGIASTLVILLCCILFAKFSQLEPYQTEGAGWICVFAPMFVIVIAMFAIPILASIGAIIAAIKHERKIYWAAVGAVAGGILSIIIALIIVIFEIGF